MKTEAGSNVIVLAALLANLAGCGGVSRGAGAPATESAPAVVFVVRHAEKDLTAADPKDPPLSEGGKRRAAALMREIDTEDLVAVLATPYARTRATAAPSAGAAGLPVTDYAPDGTEKLVAEIRAIERGHVLVVGHSNTVPEILKALGVVESVVLADDDYGDLFVVTLAKDGGAAMERRRFGE